MSELSVRQYLHNDGSGLTWGYDKREVDKYIAELEESHKKEVGQLLLEIVELKNRIAPKQSDKTLQERLNEVCEKHGVSTLQDLDWAFCESEKRHTKDCIEADKVIAEKDAEIAELKAAAKEPEDGK